MGIEAIAPRRGEVRTRDLRATLGEELFILDYVTVTVVAQTGGAITARVELTDLRAGLRTHRAFLCPSCREPRHLLILIAVEGALKCGKCHRHRTRRQTEWHLRSWNRLGGQLEDRMLRLLHPRLPRGPSHYSPAMAKRCPVKHQLILTSPYTAPMCVYRTTYTYTIQTNQFLKSDLLQHTRKYS